MFSFAIVFFFLGRFYVFASSADGSPSLSYTRHVKKECLQPFVLSSRLLLLLRLSPYR
jgi:hypothetical protein